MALSTEDETRAFLAQLEPAAVPQAFLDGKVEQDDATEAAAMAVASSIAISLKRIADALAGTPERNGVVQIADSIEALLRRRDH